MGHRSRIIQLTNLITGKECNIDLLQNKVFIKFLYFKCDYSELKLCLFVSCHVNYNVIITVTSKFPWYYNGTIVLTPPEIYHLMYVEDFQFHEQSNFPQNSILTLLRLEYLPVFHHRTFTLQYENQLFYHFKKEFE